MIKNREGYLISKEERECTKCGNIFPLTSKTVTLCNKCNSNRVINADIRGRLINGAKTRAKSRGLDFNISKEDLIIPEYCPILNIKIEKKFGQSGGCKFSPSLDRIDNSKGYIKGNIQVISFLANMMKSSANNQELLSFSKWIQSNITNFSASTNDTSLI